jgi:integrase
MAAYNDDGVWRWRRVVRLPDGKPKRGSGTPEVNTKAAAVEAERQWVNNAKAGKSTLKVAESPTLRAIHEDYLAHLKMHKSPSLHSNRVSTFRAHLLPFFGGTRLDAITTTEIDDFKKHQLSLEGDEKLEPGTVNNHLLTLTNCLRWAKKRGKLDELPEVDYLERKTATDVEHLEDAQLEAELGKATGDLHTMMVVAVDTGLRIGELLALRWGDVDFARNRIRVQRGTYRGHDRPTKTKRARNVPLTRRAKATLEAHPHGKGALVFSNAEGDAIPYATAHYRLGAATAVSGWHVLRHTFATRLAARGVPLNAIQTWMGHNSIKTTMVYAHYSPVLDAAIHVLDGDAWSPTGPKEPKEPTDA